METKHRHGGVRNASVSSRPIQQLDVLNKRTVGTHLTGPEIQHFRKMHLVKRAEITGDVCRLYDDIRHQEQPGTDGSSPYAPNQMAKSANDAWVQSATLSLLNNEQTLLHEIDAALERIENGVYGICEAIGKPVSKARLRAIPWARYCIEYARLRDVG